MGKADQVHLVRINRLFDGNGVAQGEIGEQGAAEHFCHARKNPAGAPEHQGQPPAVAVLCGALRHEAQVVRLFAHLRDECDTDGKCCAKQRHAECAAQSLFPCVARQLAQDFGFLPQQESVRKNQQGQPQRLRPRLQAADGGDPVRDEGNDHQCADQVTPRRGNMEGEFQRVGHDRRFQREEDEGE